MTLIFGSVEVEADVEANVLVLAAFEAGFVENILGGSEASLGANMFVLEAFEMGFGARIFLGGADAAILVGDLGTGKFPNGLKRGASSFAGDAGDNGATFF